VLKCLLGPEHSLGHENGQVACPIEKSRTCVGGCRQILSMLCCASPRASGLGRPAPGSEMTKWTMLGTKGSAVHGSGSSPAASPAKPGFRREQALDGGPSANLGTTSFLQEADTFAEPVTQRPTPIQSVVRSQRSVRRSCRHVADPWCTRSMTSASVQAKPRRQGDPSVGFSAVLSVHCMRCSVQTNDLS
jgi:hypothetical protein